MTLLPNPPPPTSLGRAVEALGARRLATCVRCLRIVGSPLTQKHIPSSRKEIDVVLDPSYRIASCLAKEHLQQRMFADVLNIRPGYDAQLTQNGLDVQRDRVALRWWQPCLHLHICPARPRTWSGPGGTT